MLLPTCYSFHRLTELRFIGLSIMTNNNTMTQHSPSQEEVVTFQSNLQPFLEDLVGKFNTRQTQALQTAQIETIEDIMYYDDDALEETFAAGNGGYFSLTKQQKILFIISWLKDLDAANPIPRRSLQEIRRDVNAKKNAQALHQMNPPFGIPPTIQGPSLLSGTNSGSNASSIRDGVPPSPLMLPPDIQRNNNIPPSQVNIQPNHTVTGISTITGPSHGSDRQNQNNTTQLNNRGRNSNSGKLGTNGSTSYVIDKKTKLQKLPIFSGKSGEWEEWKDSVILTLQQHGLEEYVLKDLRPQDDDPVLPKTVFVLILTAVRDSNVSSIVRSVTERTGYFA